MGPRERPGEVRRENDELASGGRRIRFAIIPTSCAKAFDLPVVDFGTAVASHEIGEAATDPHPDTDLALSTFDPDHQSWKVWQSKEDENGDACEFYSDDYIRDPSVGLLVQRPWSNAAAKAGHDPCVPADRTPYFNVTTLAQEPIHVALSRKQGDIQATRGYNIPVGQSRDIQIGLWSDGPTGTWSIDVVEGDGMAAATTRHVKITVDKARGSNDDTATITLKPTAHLQKGILVPVVSKLGDKTRYRSIIIATP